jgi:hypothetical protein
MCVSLKDRGLFPGKAVGAWHLVRAKSQQKLSFYTGVKCCRRGASTAALLDGGPLLEGVYASIDRSYACVVRFWS